jgi:hypothetical protein
MAAKNESGAGVMYRVTLYEESENVGSGGYQRGGVSGS